jgi:hypothetical protein
MLEILLVFGTLHVYWLRWGQRAYWKEVARFHRDYRASLGLD